MTDIYVGPRSTAETVGLEQDAIAWDEMTEVLAHAPVAALETSYDGRPRRARLVRGALARFFTATTNQVDVVPAVSDERRTSRVQPRRRAAYLEHAAMSREMHRL